MSDIQTDQSRLFEARRRGTRVLLAEPVEDVAYAMEVDFRKNRLPLGQRIQTAPANV